MFLKTGFATVVAHLLCPEKASTTKGINQLGLELSIKIIHIISIMSAIIDNYQHLHTTWDICSRC